MIKPLVDIKKWAEMYSIRMDKMKCHGCEKEFEPDTPVAIPRYRGVMIREHGCPFEFRRTRWVPVDEETKKFWLNFAGPNPHR